MKKQSILAGILALSFCMSAAPATADDKKPTFDSGQSASTSPSAEVEDKVAETQKTIALLGEYGVNQEAVQKAQQAVLDAQAQYEKSVSQSEDLQRQLGDMNSRLIAADSELADLDKLTRETGKKIAESRTDVGRMASDMYKVNGTSQNGLGLLVQGGKDLNGSADASYMMNHVLARREGTIQQQKELKSLQESSVSRQNSVKNAISAMRDNIKSLLAEAKEKEQIAEQERDNLEKALAAAKKSANDAKKRYNDAVVEAKNQAEAFKKLQAQLLKESNISAKAFKDAGALTKDNEMFPLPLPTTVSHVTSGYGFRPTPTGTIDYGGKGGYVHAGIDYGASCGTPIHAVADGDVWLAGSAGSSGNAVGISHGVVNGYTFATRYHHMSVVGVKVGDAVKKGDVLGLSGTTGNSNGCHLHFETLVNGKATNPVAFLK